WRQTIDLGGEWEKVEDAPNQVGGYRPVDRITMRIGRMAAPDVFDDNAYSHDPRTQFLNWGLMYNGAWDYPANARGYTYGLNCEQEINKDVGVFARAGWDDGHTEAWAFTEIDWTLAFGALVKGRCWCRPDDAAGVAFLFNGLSAGHRDYLAAGGVGFIIGDG